MKTTTRIFWIGAGLLTLALFHTAGHSLIVEKGDRPFGESPRTTGLKQIPGETFESKEAIREWAEISTFGGGRIREFDGHEGQRVIVVFRTFTSGIESSDLAVFLGHKARGWQLVVYRQPVLRDLIDVTRLDDRFVFQTRKNRKTLLELPFDGLEPVTTLAGLREIGMLSVFKPESK